MLATAVVFGGLLTKAWNAFWNWLKGNYKSNAELREKEFSELKRLVDETVAAANKHYAACNETPNKVILDEITNLTNAISAHITDDKRMFEKMNDNISGLRGNHHDALGQILAAFEKVKAKT